MGTQPDDFEEWYLANHARLVAGLLLVSGDLDLTRDAVDEACTRAFSRWDRVRRMESPAGWTFRVALNTLRRHQRRAALERRLLARRPPIGQMPAPAGEAWDVVRDLPHRQRTRSTIETVFGADTTPGREGFRPTGVAVVRSGTVYVSYDGASGGLGGPEIISIDRNGVHHLR